HRTVHAAPAGARTARPAAADDGSADGRRTPADWPGGSAGQASGPPATGYRYSAVLPPGYPGWFLPAPGPGSAHFRSANRTGNPAGWLPPRAADARRAARKHGYR